MSNYAFEAMVNPNGFGDSRYTEERSASLRDRLSDAGRLFLDRVDEEVRMFRSHSFRSNIRAAVNRVESYIKPDTIRIIDTREDLQSATPIMRRYVMAEPSVKRRYILGELSVYNGLFDDRAEGKYGSDDPTWRRVRTGGVDLMNDEVIRFTEYIDLLDDEAGLLADERADILNTWSAIRDLIAGGGEDPTDVYGGSL